jgi:hypothetical protein
MIVTLSGERGIVRRALFVVLVVVVGGGFLVPATSSQATGTPRLVPVSASVAGLTYRQWDVRWGRTQALTPVGAPNSLALTRSGRRCGVQLGNVRLMPVSFGGRLTARCTIPAGTFLVVPVTGYLASGESRRGLLAEAREAFEAIERARLTVNGRTVEPPGHVVTTPAYRVNLPRRNGLGVAAGPEWLLSRDYFAILSPPAVGTHTVTTLGVVRPPGQARFSLGVTYRITVQTGAGPGLTG